MDLKTAKEKLQKHGVDPENIKGYRGLDDLNKVAFEKFLADFLEKQLRDITPVSIYWVEDTDYAIYDEVEGGTIVGNTVYILENGERRLLCEHLDEGYEGLLEPMDPREYLRFDYRFGDSRSWVHIEEQGKEWY